MNITHIPPEILNLITNDLNGIDTLHLFNTCRQFRSCLPSKYSKLISDVVNENVSCNYELSGRTVQLLCERIPLLFQQEKDYDDVSQPTLLVIQVACEKGDVQFLKTVFDLNPNMIQCLHLAFANELPGTACREGHLDVFKLLYEKRIGFVQFDDDPALTACYFTTALINDRRDFIEYFDSLKDFQYCASEKVFFDILYHCPLNIIQRYVEKYGITIRHPEYTCSHELRHHSESSVKQKLDDLGIVNRYDKDDLKFQDQFFDFETMHNQINEKRAIVEVRAPGAGSGYLDEEEHLNLFDIFNYHCKFGHLDIVRWMEHNLTPLQCYFSCNARYMSQALILACAFGHLDIVKYLYSSNGWSDDVFQSAFVHACEQGKLDVLQWILSVTALVDVHIENDYCFKVACFYGHYHVANWLHETFGNQYDKNELEALVTKNYQED